MKKSATNSQKLASQGAHNNMHYKITKQQLEKLAASIKKLHEVTGGKTYEKTPKFEKYLLANYINNPYHIVALNY